MFETLLVNHCSPTLAGLKVANMFMYTGYDANYKVGYWNDILSDYDLHLKILMNSSNKFLIYIYRKSMLEELLNNDDIQRFLFEYGYVDLLCVDDILSILSSKFDFSSFPHEIGIFLGYPLEDVRMFILNKGKNYKYSGMWKVYSDEKKSIELFEKYKKCTLSLVHSFFDGQNIPSLCVA